MSVPGTSSTEFGIIQVPMIGMDGALVTPPLVLRNHAAILKLTAEIFPGGEIAVTEELDPEIPAPAYFVINVRARGDIHELAAKDIEWHRQIWEVAAETANSYRLSLGVQ